MKKLILWDDCHRQAICMSRSDFWTSERMNSTNEHRRIVTDDVGWNQCQHRRLEVLARHLVVPALEGCASSSSLVSIINLARDFQGWLYSE